MICNLRFKKDVLFLKMLLCFGFCTFGFEALPHPSYYFTSIVEKTHHGPVIALFSVQLLQFFRCSGGVLVSKQPTIFHCYWLIYFSYSANYKTRRVFVIILLICSYLLNCLRSIGTIVVTTESGYKKDVLFLKILLCFGFCTFGSKAMPHPSCYLTSIVEESGWNSLKVIFTEQFLIKPPFFPVLMYSVYPRSFKFKRKYQ